MQISEIQQQAKDLMLVQGWGKVSAEQRLAYVVTELGEVAEEVIELQADPTEGGRERLGMEIYDVVWNLCDLANILDIDLDAAFAKKARLNQDRTWV